MGQGAERYGENMLRAERCGKDRLGSCRLGIFTFVTTGVNCEVANWENAFKKDPII